MATATAKAKADGLLAKLKAGADFKALASTENSDASAKSNGGDLGWMSRDDLRDPQLGSAALLLKKGEISPVIQTSEGYHILKAEDRKNGFEPSFENSGAKAKDELAAKRASAQASQLAPPGPGRRQEGLQPGGRRQGPSRQRHRHRLVRPRQRSRPGRPGQGPPVRQLPAEPRQGRGPRPAPEQRQGRRLRRHHRRKSRPRCCQARSRSRPPPPGHLTGPEQEGRRPLQGLGGWLEEGREDQGPVRGLGQQVSARKPDE